MNKTLKFSLIAALVVAVIGITSVGVTYAQGDDPTHPHDILAELLGLTSDELRDEIQSGTSVEELADAAGVDLDAFRAEMQETRAEEHKVRLQEALENGDITQEQYDWMMEGVENGYMGGRGFGGFKGRGGFNGEDGRMPFGGRGGFGSEDGNKPFGGRGGFGHKGGPSFCGMEPSDN